MPDTTTDTIHENIAAHLPRIARSHPDMLAVAVQTGSRYTELTFAQLETRSSTIAAGLATIGITPGMRTVLMVKPGLEFFALTFGLFKAGAVPVLVDPGMGIKNLKTCLAEAQPEAFIGIPKAHIARILLGWGKSTVRIVVTAGPRLFWGGTTLRKLARTTETSYPVHRITPYETAAILFTSGSTGIPKGAVYTHEIFNTQVKLLKQEYAIEPGERDVATFPLFALFGPALGMAAVVPDMDAAKPGAADPARIIAAAVDYQATNMFCSPALIEKVGRYAYDRKDSDQAVMISSLKRVISAGAPARPDSLKRFGTLLPDGVEVLTSYGATEALPVAAISTDELLGPTAEITAQGGGICVGRPFADARVRIIRITDGPIPVWSDDLELPAGEKGEITVQGTMASREYFNRPESTAAAKIYDSEGAFFCHRMGDIGYIDNSGLLWMCGRRSHRVVLEDRTLFTVPCERIFVTLPDVARTALVGVQQAGRPSAVLCVERSKTTASSAAEIRQQLLAMAAAHAMTEPITTILFHPAFPVDVRHNAKIYREQLTQWAQEQVNG